MSMFVIWHRDKKEEEIDGESETNPSDIDLMRSAFQKKKKPPSANKAELKTLKERGNHAEMKNLTGEPFKQQRNRSGNICVFASARLNPLRLISRTAYRCDIRQAGQGGKRSKTYRKKRFWAKTESAGRGGKEKRFKECSRFFTL